MADKSLKGFKESLNEHDKECASFEGKVEKCVCEMGGTIKDRAKFIAVSWLLTALLWGVSLDLHSKCIGGLMFPERCSDIARVLGAVGLIMMAVIGLYMVFLHEGTKKEIDSARGGDSVRKAKRILERSAKIECSIAIVQLFLLFILQLFLSAMREVG